MAIDPMLTVEPPRAYRVWSRVSVAFIVLAIIAAGFALELNTQLSPSHDWIVPALQVACVLLLAAAVASIWVAYAVKDGWRNTLITTVSWIAMAGVVILAIVAFSSLRLHTGSLVHTGKVILIATAHIGGAVVATFVLGLFLSRGIAALQARRTRRWLGEAALTLGVPAEELESPAHFEALVKYSHARFTNELLRNRLSDFLGQVLRVWGWFGIFVQAVLIAWVIYVTVTDGARNAPYAWLVLVVEVLGDTVALAAGFLCRLLTGRDPGQAYRARAFLSKAAGARSFADVG
jgi:hypothetical protein